MTLENQVAQVFIDHRSEAEASEMANFHIFIICLCGVSRRNDRSGRAVPVKAVFSI